MKTIKSSRSLLPLAGLATILGLGAMTYNTSANAQAVMVPW